MASKPKRTVTYDGRSYKLRGDKIEVPDFAAMDRIGVLQWLSRHTYATGNGLRTRPNPLAGLGEVINVTVR